MQDGTSYPEEPHRFQPSEPALSAVTSVSVCAQSIEATSKLTTAVCLEDRWSLDV